MRFSIGELKNTKVYLYGEDEPFGIFSDTILDEYGIVKGYVVKTISIVPISKIVKQEDIDRVENEKIVLTKDVTLLNPERFKNEVNTKFVYADRIKTAVMPDLKENKLKDMRFDFETGQICDVLILKNIITGKEEIPVNKIFAKDNTIYIKINQK